VGLAIQEHIELDSRLVLFLDAATRDEAIRSLVEALHAAGKIEDKDRFNRAVLEREKIVSTGIGMGVAIPHAKLPEYNQFFMAVGIQKERGLEWHGLDGLPVHLIFLIGGPENRQTDYLKILSQLTTVIKDEDKRKRLTKATSPKEVWQLLQE
jgi:nitrogen PTS system EIIA component